MKMDLLSNASVVKRAACFLEKYRLNKDSYSVNTQ